MAFLMLSSCHILFRPLSRKALIPAVHHCNTARPAGRQSDGVKASGAHMDPEIETVWICCASGSVRSGMVNGCRPQKNPFRARTAWGPSMLKTGSQKAAIIENGRQYFPLPIFKRRYLFMSAIAVFAAIFP